jgi:hypothetical protein
MLNMLGHWDTGGHAYTCNEHVSFKNSFEGSGTNGVYVLTSAVCRRLVDEKKFQNVAGV